MKSPEKNKNLRVMQVGYSFAIGGSEMVARDLAIGLASMKWPTAVCALEYDGPLREELEEAGVETKVIDRKPHEIIGPMFRLWKAFRKFRPDIVHTHHLYELVYACPGALLCGAKLIHTEHEFHSLLDPSSRRRLRFLARFCSKITAVNAETALFLRNEVKIPAHKIVTIVNGIDVDQFTCDRREYTRNELGVPPQAPVVGIVARLETPKNHELLIRAFQRVTNRFPECQLLIIGDGSLRQRLETLAAELSLSGKIKFLGARRDIPELLSAIDIFALSSDFEGLPVALLEAMASGLPVVSTSAGGISTVITNGFSGYLVEPGDVKALTESLMRFLSDYHQAKVMGTTAREHIKTHYSLKSTLNAYIKLYLFSQSNTN